MVRDLDVPVEIVGVPTVREPDGLALSSRNRYLDPDRAAVGPGPVGLADRRGGARGAVAGATPETVLAAARTVLGVVGGGDVELDYLALTDPELGPAADGTDRPGC